MMVSSLLKRHVQGHEDVKQASRDFRNYDGEDVLLGGREEPGRFGGDVRGVQGQVGWPLQQ